MNKLYTLITLLLVVPISLTHSPAQALDIHLIPLQHRSAEEIIPVIKPLIADGGTVTGLNNQLIVKTTADNLQQIRLILQTIDKAARKLVIYVRHASATSRQDHENSLSARHSSGDLTVSSNADTRRQGHAGSRVRLGKADGNQLTYQTLNTRATDNDENLFHVQTLEGKAAFIQTGAAVPFAKPQTFITHGGAIVTETIEYRDVNSGFYVLPQLSGDKLTLMISPQLASLDSKKGGIIKLENAETTVSGRLGEWLSLGGIERHSSRENRRNLSRSRHTNQENSHIELKVVELH